MRGLIGSSREYIKTRTGWESVSMSRLMCIILGGDLGIEEEVKRA